MNNPSYVYTSSEQETKRLNKQSDLIKESSIAHLLKAGLVTSLKVADVGCGSGAMTTFLATQVGPTGHVYAIDIDEKQIEVTRKALSDQNLTNVTFIRCDISREDPEELKAIMSSVDLIYMRFVLMHLKRPDMAIQNLRKVLKDGGCLANQESLISSTHCEPIDSPDIRATYAMSVDLGNKLSTDKNIGGRLIDLYENGGFINQTYYKVTHMIPMKEAAFVLLQSGDEQKKLLLEHDITTEEEFEKHYLAITQLGEINDRSLVFDQGYIIVRK